MNLQLLGNRVLISPVEEETAQGFVIPEEYRTFRIGIVAAIGNGQRLKNGARRPIPCKVGDKVALDDQYRMPIEIDNKQYFLVSDEKVMAVIP
jgi:co-chaperonin GroES (HSP10)